MNCRHCKAFLKRTFLDLCFAPLTNAYLSKEDLNHPEVYLPYKLKFAINAGWCRPRITFELINCLVETNNL